MQYSYTIEKLEKWNGSGVDTTGESNVDVLDAVFDSDRQEADINQSNCDDIDELVTNAPLVPLTAGDVHVEQVHNPPACDQADEIEKEKSNMQQEEPEKNEVVVTGDVFTQQPPSKSPTAIPGTPDYNNPAWYISMLQNQIALMSANQFAHQTMRCRNTESRSIETQTEIVSAETRSSQTDQTKSKLASVGINTIREVGVEFGTMTLTSAEPIQTAVTEPIQSTIQGLKAQANSPVKPIEKEDIAALQIDQEQLVSTESSGGPISLDSKIGKYESEAGGTYQPLYQTDALPTAVESGTALISRLVNDPEKSFIYAETASSTTELDISASTRKIMNESDSEIAEPVFKCKPGRISGMRHVTRPPAFNERPDRSMAEETISFASYKYLEKYGLL